MPLSDDEIKEISRLVYGVASTNFEEAKKSAYSFSKLMIGERAESGLEYVGMAIEEMQKRLPEIRSHIRITIHGDESGFESEIISLFENFKRATKETMGFWNNPDLDASPDFELSSLKSVSVDILSEAGERAFPLKDEMLKMLETEIGNPNGILTIEHQWVAIKVLANMGAVTDTIFNSIMEYTIENDDHVGRAGIQSICEKDESKFEIVLKRIDDCDDDDDLSELLGIVTCIGQIGSKYKDTVVEILLGNIDSKEIDVVNAACKGLHILDEFPDRLNDEILNRRDEEIKKEEEEYYEDEDDTREEDFDHEGEAERDQLLEELKAEDSFIRGKAAEALQKFVDEEMVAHSLVKTMRDEEPIHDFDMPSVYAMRSLAKSKVHAHLAYDRLTEIVNYVIEAEMDRNEKNKAELVTGVEYLTMNDYDVSDIGALGVAMGDKGKDILAMLKKFEKYLALRDVYGYDRRVEKIRAIGPI